MQFNSPPFRNLDIRKVLVIKASGQGIKHVPQFLDISGEAASLPVLNPLNRLQGLQRHDAGTTGPKVILGKEQ